MTYVYLIGSKVVLYPLLFQSFLFDVMIIHHFNTVKLYHRYGRVQVFVDLTHVHNTLNTVESGHYLYCCADWSLYPGGVKTGELVRTSQSQDGV